MDNLTHTVFGVALARAGLARRCGRGTTLALALASNLPDLDVLWLWWGGEDAFLARRVATHALPVLPVWALLGALALRPLVRGLPFRRLWLLVLAGMAGHVLLDLINSYGVVLFWPLSAARFELGLLFVIDLVFAALLLGPLLVLPLVRSGLARERWFQVALVLLAGYLAACAGLKLRARDLIAAASPAAAADPARVQLFPEVLGAHRFRAVEREPHGGRYSVWLCWPLRGTVERLPDVPTQELDPRLQRVQATARARRLLGMFAAPVWTLLPDGRHVQLHDLRFCSAVWPRATPFVRVLPLDP